MNENPLLGIGLLVASTMFFSCSDAIAKYLTATLPAIEIAWVRYIVFSLMAAGLVLRQGAAGMRSRRPVLQMLRGLGVVGSALFFILALAHLPMAQAATINFASPLLITLLAVPVLGERVGVRGWLAVLAGFAGVLIVVRPGIGGLHPAAWLVVASSLCWALAMLITRTMAATERPAATLLWTALSGLGVLTLALPFGLAPMTFAEMALTVALGIAASSGQWLAVLAYRQAAASTLAPLAYGQLLWSSALGYAVFGALPDRWTLAGAAVIIASGLYAIHLARRPARRQGFSRRTAA